jgi:hypothetical protein
MERKARSILLRHVSYSLKRCGIGVGGMGIGIWVARVNSDFQSYCAPLSAIPNISLLARLIIREERFPVGMVEI